MKLELYNTVVLAEDYERMRDWYVKALDLELKQEWTEDYHYAELARDGKLIVGIADTKEMKTEPYTPRRNSTLMQLAVDDIEALLARVKENGGETKGPNFEEKEGFRYGLITDPEGNQVWIVETLDAES